MKTESGFEKGHLLPTLVSMQKMTRQGFFGEQAWEITLIISKSLESITAILALRTFNVLLLQLMVCYGTYYILDLCI